MIRATRCNDLLLPSRGQFSFWDPSVSVAVAGRAEVGERLREAFRGFMSLPHMRGPFARVPHLFHDRSVARHLGGIDWPGFGKGAGRLGGPPSDLQLRLRTPWSVTAITQTVLRSRTNDAKPAGWDHKCLKVVCNGRNIIKNFFV
jgi:hypothetical protein